MFQYQCCSKDSLFIANIKASEEICIASRKTKKTPNSMF